MKTSRNPHANAAHEATRLQAHDTHTRTRGGQATPSHGQYKGFMFRPGRAPSPAIKRGNVALRPRSRLRRAADAMPDHDGLEDAIDTELDVRRDARDRAVEVDEAGQARHDESLPDRDGNEARATSLALRMKPPAGLSSAREAEAWLAREAPALAGAIAERAGDGLAAGEASELAIALATALLALPDAQWPASGPAAAAVQAAAMRAYLASGARGTLASLSAVKAVLMQRATKPSSPPGEAGQDRLLLLPLTLLNADRPRTARQCGEACERLELLMGAR